MATPQPWGHIIYSFGRPFLDHRYYTLSLAELCPGEEKIFKEILQFYTSYSQNTPPPHSLGWGGGHEIYNFLSSYPTDVIYHLVKIGPVVLEKKM